MQGGWRQRSPPLPCPLVVPGHRPIPSCCPQCLAVPRGGAGSCSLLSQHPPCSARSWGHWGQLPRPPAPAPWAAAVGQNPATMSTTPSRGRREGGRGGKGGMKAMGCCPGPTEHGDRHPPGDSQQQKWGQNQCSQHTQPTGTGRYVERSPLPPPQRVSGVRAPSCDPRAPPCGVTAPGTNSSPQAGTGQVPAALGTLPVLLAGISCGAVGSAVSQRSPSPAPSLHAASCVGLCRAPRAALPDGAVTAAPAQYGLLGILGILQLAAGTGSTQLAWFQRCLGLSCPPASHQEPSS